MPTKVSTKAAKAYGVGMSQEDMMHKDECILLSEADEMVGHASKKDAHVFSKKTPRGQLHRAFSVFLFNSEGELLLQKRAKDKITFPGVWTNTCCSHPLYGYTPSEVDEPDAVAKGDVKGVKAAAIRKLEHELGIAVGSIKPEQFKYLTRLHYWAADVVTHGPKSPWGEHEIDYILFAQADVKVKPNPEEVDDVKYVTLAQLQEMMDPKSKLLWSPWFRIIAEQFLPHWWADLDKTLTTNALVDYKTIHRFDPTAEHMGGAGNAGAWLGVAKSPFAAGSAGTGTGNAGDKGLKQGAYGKVKIHKHSKIDQILRPDEMVAMVKLLAFGANMTDKVDVVDDNVKFCNDMLGKVSRSFASVIRQLPKGLCLDILIFYLALRALDTIEDDMEAFKGREEVKIQHLNTFYKTGLVTDGWTMQGVGEGDERTLLEEFHKCVSVFKSLLPQSQAVIADITKRMGQGMASYVQKDLGQGTVTVKDYDLYCHYVAGLVGEGLSRLFVCTGYESPKVSGVATTLANTMGLFLQKTNIIRDYLEDYVDGRAFWPQEIWKGYTTTKELGELAEQKNRVKAVECLNHLVTNALECVPECLAYIGLLQTAEVFRFCAIPQVMAIATLAELYNNPKVFTGVVKIRKGQTCCLFLDSGTVEGVHKWFNILAKSIRRKIDSRDPNAAKTRAICDKIVELTASKTVSARLIEGASTANFVACWVLAATTYVLLCRDERHLKFIRSLDSGSLFSLSPHAPWRTLFGSCKTHIFSLSSSSCRLDQACLLAAVVSVLVIFAYSLSTSRKVFKVASDLDKSA